MIYRTLNAILLFAGLIIWDAQSLCAQAVQASFKPQRAIVIKPTKKALKTPMAYAGNYALLVGVSDYDVSSGWSDLESVPRELDEIQAVLTGAGFEVTRVRNPDSKALKSAFEDFIIQHGYKKDNRLFFYYSGHGHSIIHGRKQRGFLVPADAPSPLKDNEIKFLQKSLQMDQILSWSRQMTAKHALFLFDSCFSGTVFSSKAFPMEPPHITKLTAYPVRQYLSAGSSGETVPAQSMFAKFVVRGLKGEADRNKDQYVLGTELGLYIKEKLAYYESGTTPQIGKIRDPDLDRGEFVIRVPVQEKKVLVKPFSQEPVEKQPITPKLNLPPNIGASPPKNDPVKPSKKLPVPPPDDAPHSEQVIHVVKELIRMDREVDESIKAGYSSTGSRVQRIQDERDNYLKQYRDLLELEFSGLHLTLTSLRTRLKETDKPVVDVRERLERLAKLLKKEITPPSIQPKLVTPKPAATPKKQVAKPLESKTKMPEKLGQTLTNSIGMTLAYIPSGKFTMGSPLGEEGRYGDESQRDVALSASILMQTAEVTQAQWTKLMGKNPSRFKDPRNPVERVSWEEAVNFCNKLSNQERRVYTLPTEAEWEYACRAGTTSAWAGGEEMCWFDFNAKGMPRAVATKKSNNWGLFDMHGNVAEWCRDGYQLYPRGGAIDPLVMTAKERVYRGGHYASTANACRSAKRWHTTSTTRLSTIGFRVVMRPSEYFVKRAMIAAPADQAAIKKKQDDAAARRRKQMRDNKAFRKFK